MISYLLVISSFLVTIIVAIPTREIPKNIIHVCRRTDPNINQCIIDSGNFMRPVLAKGNKELNIPSIEPLIMDEFISEFSAGMLIKASDVKAFGCSDYFVRNLTFSLKKLRFKFDISLPRLRIQAKYKLSGQLLNFLPVNGSGNMDANVTDCRAVVRIDAKLVKKGNDSYLTFDKMKLNVKVGGGRAYLDDFFNGNKLLGDVINNAINENFQEFLKELLPVIEKNLQSRFLDIANKIIEPYTFDQLMPLN